MTQYVRAINIANNSIKSFVFDTNTSNTLNTAVATAEVVSAVAISANVSAQAVNTFVTLQTLEVAKTPPTINVISIADSSYNVTSNTIADPFKTYLRITGTNFQPSAIVMVGSSNTALSTTYFNPFAIGAELPFLPNGTYPLYAINNNGGTAIRVNAITTDNLQRQFTMGRGTYGNLGLNDSVARSSPTQVGSDTNWQSVDSNENHTLAIKTDGTLWMWGRYTTISPIQVGSDTDWRFVSVGITNTWVALKSNNSLWTGGTTPSQGTGTNWNTANQEEGVYLATKTDGTLWHWGKNGFGANGRQITLNGDTDNPTQVGTLTNWSNVVSGNYDALAVKNDGTLWSWGSNSSGQLGQNGTIRRSSPVQVGTDINWSKIAINGNESSFAIKTDGTLWSWGRNQDGECGLNDRLGRSSPTQVGTANNWSSINSWADPSNSKATAVAIKTDGTLWAWGSNSNGQLGLNSLINRSSPTQVGTANNWILAATGGYKTVLVSRGPFY
jgi:alpha-tubulin suppressor-like RCC1 family protein